MSFLYKMVEKYLLNGLLLYLVVELLQLAHENFINGNLTEKTTHFMEKVWEQISQVFPIRWVLLTFLMLWEIWVKNQCYFHAMKYNIGC